MDAVIAFLFTDIEDSTGLAQQFPDGMRSAQARHDEILRKAARTFGGRVFRIVGDAFCISFPDAGDALIAAFEAQRAMQSVSVDPAGTIPLRFRAALHAGMTEERDGEYYGVTPAKAARLVEVIHGGQIILTGDAAALIRAKMPAEASLHDLGEHRLRSFQTDDRLYQLTHPDLPGRFLPLRPTASVPNNLPRQLTPFIGREKEISEIRQRTATSPLMTLTGAGGCGKTRLALQVGDSLLTKFPDGVWFADLARCADAAAAEQILAATVGATLTPGANVTETIAAQIQGRHVLLLADNCEHIVRDVAPLLAELLKIAPDLHVLATSREALGISGETLFPVHPMPVPPEESATDARRALTFEAVRLYVERAGARDANFRLTDDNAPIITRICRRLDGIPLGIVLIASWADMLSPAQIEARLKDRFKIARASGDRDLQTRQKTLRASIDFSYDLLDTAERALFARLSVFRGGFTADAAEEICGGDPVDDVWLSLAALVRKSLIETEETQDGKRFRLLETIREYAEDKLNADGDADGSFDAVPRRHREYFVRWASEMRPRLVSPEMQMAMRQADAELDNIRAALRAVTDTADGLRLIASLYWHWRVRGSVREGVGWAAQFLAAEEAAPVADDALRADAWSAAGVLYWAAGDRDAAQRRFRDALEFYRQRGDDENAGRCLTNLGGIWGELDDLDAAADYLQQGYEAFLRAGNETRAASAQANIGSIAARHGKMEDAAQRYDEAIGISRRTRDAFALSSFLAVRGNLAINQGDVKTARPLLRECFDLRRRLRFDAGLAEAIDAFAEIAEQESRFEEALVLISAATALRERAGTPRPPAQAEFMAALRAQVAERLGPEVAATQEQIGEAYSIEELARLVAEDSGS